MDSKMSRKFIVYCLLFILCGVTGCKQNNWIDWKTQNEVWLLNNKQQADIQVTSTGLQYRVISDPTPQDARPNVTSTVICDYSVKLINGYYLQKDVKYASIPLSNAIPGFAEGCHLIHNNGDIELFIPASLGYDYEAYSAGNPDNAEGSGTEGTQSYIPPHSALIYTIHICGVSDN